MEAAGWRAIFRSLERVSSFDRGINLEDVGVELEVADSQ